MSHPQTMQDRRDMAALYARRQLLAASEVNQRAHEIVDLARLLMVKIKGFVKDFTPTEAGKLLPGDAPEEAQLWGTNTFDDPHHQFKLFEGSLYDFIGVAACDLPPLPAEGS